ncbi:hypothetical protein VTO73DRAFT_3079 [Trametes versicolor]
MSRVYEVLSLLLLSFLFPFFDGWHYLNPCCCIFATPRSPNHPTTRCDTSAPIYPPPLPYARMLRSLLASA